MEGCKMAGKLRQLLNQNTILFVSSASVFEEIVKLLD